VTYISSFKCKYKNTPNPTEKPPIATKILSLSCLHKHLQKPLANFSQLFSSPIHMLSLLLQLGFKKLVRVFRKTIQKKGKKLVEVELTWLDILTTLGVKETEVWEIGDTSWVGVFDVDKIDVRKQTVGNEQL
jgi:hypothetical protein